MPRLIKKDRKTMLFYVKWGSYMLIALFLIIFISKLNWYQISEQILNIGWKFWLVFPINLIGYVFGALSWKQCLGKEKGAQNFLTLFVIRHIGETLSIINPTNIIAGDGAKHLLLRTRCVDENASMVSIILSRVVLMIAAVVLGLVSLFYLLITHSGAELNVITVIGISVVFAGLAGIVWWILTSRKLWLFQILRRTLQKWKDNSKVRRILNRTKHVNYALTSYHKSNKRGLLLSLAYALLHWIMGAIEFGYLIFLLGYSINVLDAVSLEMGVALVKSIGSFVPGQVGIEEYGNKVMLLSIGIGSASIWVSVSILRRLRQLIWIGVGMLFYLFYKKEKQWKFYS